MKFAAKRLSKAVQKCADRPIRSTLAISRRRAHSSNRRPANSDREQVRGTTRFRGYPRVESKTRIMSFVEPARASGEMQVAGRDAETGGVRRSDGISPDVGSPTVVTSFVLFSVPPPSAANPASPKVRN